MKTQKQRLNEYQKYIDLVLESEIKKHWFICQLDSFLDMMDLPINKIDKDWVGWENGECELVNKMIIKSVSKVYCKSFKN